MFGMQKRGVTLVVAVFLVVLMITVSGCGGGGSQSSAKTVVAEVNGETITRGELDAYTQILRLFMPQLDAMLKDSSTRAMFEGQILEAMVENLILQQAAAELGITVTEADLRQAYEMSKAQMIGMNFASEEEMNAKIKELKIKEADLVAFVGSSAYTDRLDAYFAADLTDEDIEQFLAENPVYGREPHVLELSHILFETEEEALAARERLEAGEDFGDLAVELSQDPTAANQGHEGFRGYLGAEIAEVNQQFWEEFMAGANAIEADGDISQPVETRGGWHLIKLHKRVVGESLSPAEARQNGADVLARERLNEFLNEFFESAVVEMNLNS